MQKNIELYFKNRQDWRQWLEKNHDSFREVWLVFFKKHSGQPSMKYDDAVEEALCYGWIDSLIKRLDEDRYARKFTPRVDAGKWSADNLRRVQKLKESGQMTEIGLAKVPDDVQALPAISSRTLTIPSFFAEALAKHPQARTYFEQLAPSYRRNYIHWISSAKKEDTRQRRIAEVISLLEQGKKLGMK